MRKSEKTLQNILHTATILFGEQGYSATSIGDISKNAGISRGILYYYVKNKDELYIKCLENCANKLFDYLSLEYKKVTNLYDFITLRDKFITEYPQYDKILFYLMAEKPDDLRSRIKEIKQPLFSLDKKTCTRFFNEFELGENVNIDDALNFLWIIQQSIPSILITPHETPISEQLSRIMQIFLNGLTQDLTL